MLEQSTKKADVVGSVPYVENGQAARASVPDVHKALGPPPKILEDQPEQSVKMDVFSYQKEMRDLRGRTSSLEVQVSVMKNFPDLSGLCSQKLCGRIQEGDVVVKNISRVVDLFLDLYQVVDRHEV
jgi:hypothetical protein